MSKFGHELEPGMGRNESIDLSSMQEVPSLSFDWIRSFSSPVSLHLYTERYVNKGAYHSYRHFSEVTKEFRPLDGALSFKLPYVFLPRDKVRVYESVSSEQLIQNIAQNEGLRFFIHPDMIDYYGSIGVVEFSKSNCRGSVEAVPTSSTRTLVIPFKERLYMVKVDLSGKRLGRLTRHLPEKSAVQSNYVNRLLNELVEQKLVPEEFAFLPEPLGLGFSTGEYTFANIYREYEPLPRVATRRFKLPVFSLYSPDLNNPGNSLIIEQLVIFSGLREF